MAAYPEDEEYLEEYTNLLESLPDELYGKIQEFLNNEDF